MIVNEVIERLAGMDPAPFALVEGVAELAALDDAPLAWPAAYVFAKEEAAGESQYANLVRQRVELDFCVVIVTHDVTDATGGAASAGVEPLKAAVRRSLLGWQPPSADDVVTDIGGQIVKAKNGQVWWEHTFATAFFVEQE